MQAKSLLAAIASWIVPPEELRASARGGFESDQKHLLRRMHDGVTGGPCGGGTHPMAATRIEPNGRILLRATNWVGDAVMSLPAVERIREAFPRAHLAVLARPRVAGIYAGLVDEVIPYEGTGNWRGLPRRLLIARALRKRRFDAAILLPNEFDAALLARLAGIPVRIGYDVKRRGAWLTVAVPLPAPGEIPRHQSFYYLELLRRAGLVDRLPESPQVRIRGVAALREAGRRRLPGTWLGVAPGAANGRAKRWSPERFAEAAAIAAAGIGAKVALFGSADDRGACASLAASLRGRGIEAIDFAGATDVSEFLGLAAACVAMIGNDSGAMHVADALGVPTVAVFGPTDPEATGPTGALSAVVREPVDCAPCLLHDCPVDHRCMIAVGASRVSDEVSRLVALSRSAGGTCPPEAAMP